MMRTYLLAFLEIATIVSWSRGNSLAVLSSPCGDWIPFKNEKCVKLIDRVGLQNKEDAEIVCKTLIEEQQGEVDPSLVTVKNQEMQTFLQELLFKEQGIVDNVWLGLNVGADDAFQWNDGTELHFTNWANESIDSHQTDHERNCVQMESGEGVYATGLWVKANCKKRNSVACEKIQPMTLNALENVVLNLILEVTEAQKQISDANEKIDNANQEISNLKAYPVPINFIYTQLPDQVPPSTIWPQMKWLDVSGEYAGLFFRAAGGGAEAFGTLQQPNSPRLSKVQCQKIYKNGGGEHKMTYVPADGAWSDIVFSGSWEGNNDMFLKFQLSNGELRPRNKAFIIWKRIG